MTTLYRNGKPVEIKLAVDKLDPEFPAKFFEGGRKPKIIVPKYEGNTDALYKAIRGEIKARALTPKSIKAFLFRYGAEIRVTSDQDWTSFGITIAKENDEIAPWNLCEIEEDGVYESKMSEPIKEKDHMWMFVYCIGLYRLGKITDSTYQNNIIKTVDKVLKTIDKEAASLSTGAETAVQVVNDVNYCKMIACIDMYFYQFKNHDLAIARVGSISSRYRDCAALLGINHLAMLGGGDPSIGIRWALEPMVKDDIDRLITPDQETAKVGSYMPYMMDLGASKLSPYSTTVNSSFHLFVHAAGALSLDQRSINARFITAPNVNGVIRNAAFFIFAMNKSVEWSIGFTKEPETEKQPLKVQISGGKNVLPKSKEIEDWMNWRKSMKEDFDTVIDEFLRDRASRIANVRPATVGHYIKTTYGV
ncbi:nucleoprotein [Matariya virus]|uniref:Nucleoprotein n=1 Tax=Matariya virus TaxID=1272948 RepID=A0AAE8XEP7_9RHAB|nr:nucleoprotein [Matariya virus]UAU42903.1 nucleoprotein [Matariya virus]WAD86863.1 nucleoprotein [Matariya virus]